jgi:hypothetical protein
MTAFLFVTACMVLLAGLVSRLAGTCPGRRGVRKTRAFPLHKYPQAQVDKLCGKRQVVGV